MIERSRERAKERSAGQGLVLIVIFIRLFLRNLIFIKVGSSLFSDGFVNSSIILYFNAHSSIGDRKDDEGGNLWWSISHSEIYTHIMEEF